MKVEIITPDGTRTPYKWESKSKDGNARLQEMYRLIGPKCSTVEHIATAEGGHLWMDEEGKYHDLAYNAEAATIPHEAGGAPADFVSGTVILETLERKARAS